MQKVEESIVYIPFAEIADPHFTPDQLAVEYAKVVENMKTDFWKSNYEGLVALRVFNKFHFDFLCSKLDDVDLGIKRCLDSLRSGILKLALLFMQELAGLSPAQAGPTRGEQLKSYLPKIIPLLLLKLMDAKKFIVKEVGACLNNIATYSWSVEVVASLCEQCLGPSAKNPVWIDNTMTYIEMILHLHMNKEFVVACRGFLFAALAGELKTMRKALIRRVTDIMAGVKKCCGPDTLPAIMKDSGIVEAEVAKLLALTSEKPPEAKKLGFKAYIQSVNGGAKQ